MNKALKVIVCCVVVCSGVVVTSEKFQRTYDQGPATSRHPIIPRLLIGHSFSRFSGVLSGQGKNSRPRLIPHNNLMGTFVGPVDLAAQELSYAQLPVSHISTPVSMSRPQSELPVVLRHGLLVCILGTKKAKKERTISIVTQPVEEVTPEQQEDAFDASIRAFWESKAVKAHVHRLYLDLLEQQETHRVLQNQVRAEGKENQDPSGGNV